VHATGCPTHRPATHASFVVQGVKSLQLVPSGARVVAHWPVVSSHALVWHVVANEEQSSARPPQTPLRQLSLTVHRKPSLHDEPSTLGRVAHWPVAASQKPTSHAVAGIEHAFGLPRHVPATQTSRSLHPLVSSQL